MSNITTAVAAAISSAVPSYERSRFTAQIAQATSNVEQAITKEAEAVVAEVGRRFGSTYAEQAKALFIERGLLPEPTVTVSIEVPQQNLDALAAAVSSATEVLAQATAALQQAQRTQR